MPQGTDHLPFLSGLPWGWTLLLALAAAFALGFVGAPLWAWTAAAAVFLAGLGAPSWLWVVFLVLAVIFNLKPLRRVVVTRQLMALLRRLGILPSISATEREALEAGTVWAEGELFSGHPDWARLMRESYPELSEEEKAFLEGPVEELCAMTDDWEVYQRRDLPPEVWQALKDKGVFGMIIKKKWGGLEFSAAGVSAVIAKLSSRSAPLGITAMLPNSLGPAELIMHYGTPAQQDYWLPRLATGEEIPCFALTEPHAGSDAGGIRSTAEVFRGEDGEPMLRLNWEKRYITLASRATVFGLAVKLRDPENLLGRGTNPGITCVLCEAHREGVERGEQHDPLGVPFVNCPFRGKDVVVPADHIIGGAAWAGRGWRMLMETLAAGRGIMLPAQATAGTKAAARVAGAYSIVRKQFGLPVGRFEGVQEPLARIGGSAYLLEAARRYTCGGLDGGAKPAVVSAIAKYNSTELFRKAINDAMDVVGGAGISRGPRNLLAHAYWGAPISITVEGANILTRTLMIYGQGALRCHPWAYREIKALAEGDLAGFDRAFWGHIGYIVHCKCRALLLSATRGRLERTGLTGWSRFYAQKISWASACFAFLSETAMAMYGGDLKRQEAITGRFSDALSWMYLGTATIRRFEAEGRREEDLPFFRQAMDTALLQIQEAFCGLLRNFHAPWVGWLFRGPVQWWAYANPISRGPKDRNSLRVARLLQRPGEQRDRILDGLYLPQDPAEAFGRLEQAFALAVQAEEVLGRIKRAVRERRLPKGKPLDLLEQAREAGVVTAEECELVARAEAARNDAIQVDSFDDRAYYAASTRGHAGEN
ncbi:MAG: acyl-CoA dehydrogenase [Planctomycetota bacterium]|nr:MAG: acyl-CoA dehydrogenase [Planctomycetota bacterium]